MNAMTKHTNETGVNVQHPYLGLSSFDEEHKDYFFGRSNEIKNLYRKIGRSTLTVLFGKSGLGKSSLLRAGLFPVLRKNYQLPIYLRINFGQSDRHPLEQIKTELSDAIQALDEEATPIGDMTLWEYFHRTKILKGLVKPVLVFDQFEEVFTLGNQNQVEELLQELGDLIENRVPLSVQHTYESQILPFQHTLQDFKIIFSLREDYLAQLENYSLLIPSILTSRFRILQLNLDHALEAVYEPAKQIIEKKEAQKIVDLLAQNLSESSDNNLKDSGNIEIEPFLLSLICDRINQLRFDSEGNMISEKITSEIMDTVDINEIVASFYRDVAANTSEELNTFIEKHLLTSDGYRRLQPMIDIQELFKVPEEEIQELIDKRILRKEIWNGREQVELIHDVLVPIVKERRERRLKKERDIELEKVLDIQKKEQDAQFEKQRRYQRNKYIRATLFMILFIGLISYFFIDQRNSKRKRYSDIAEQLTYKSLAISGVDGREKAILARLAYQFKTKYNGKINRRIYMSLVNSLEELNGPGFGENYAKLKTGSSYQKHLKDWVLTDTSMYTLTREGQILHWYNDSIVSNIDSIDAICYAMGHDIDNNFLFIGDNKSRVWLIDIQNQYKKTPINFNNKIRVFENDDKKVYGSGREGIIYSWNTSNDLESIVNSKDSITLLKDNSISSLESGKKYLAAGTYNGDVFLIDKKSLTSSKLSFPVQISEEEKSQITSMSFSNDENSLVIGTAEGLLLFYDMNKNHFSSFVNSSVDIKDIQHSPNSSILATSDGLGTTTLWDLANFDRILKIDREDILCKESANCISFNQSGETLFVGYNDGSIIKWPVNFPKLSVDICDVLNKKTFVQDDDGNIVIDSTMFPKLSDSEWIKYIGSKIFHDSNIECELYKTNIK